jgi:hypothetical protein
MERYVSPSLPTYLITAHSTNKERLSHVNGIPFLKNRFNAFTSTPW